MKPPATTPADPLRVLIVGCGNIAGRFDEGRPRASEPLTHAGGFAQDPRFVLAACVDPDAKRREAFMAAWRIPAGFESLAAALVAGERFDVISICSPTVCHESDLETAIDHSPRMIFCEKPVTPSAEVTERLVAECAARQVALAVNYTRRWDPEIAALRADILAQKWGPLRSVAAVYNKGVLNNGSHLIDLLHLILGPLEIVTVGRPVSDYLADDPSIPAWLETAAGTPIQIGCGHAGDYALFEIQFIFADGVLAMEEGGMAWRWRRAVDSENFKGYRTLTGGETQPGSYRSSMRRAIDNIHHAIRDRATLASTGASALVTQRLCEKLKLLAAPLSVPAQ